MIAASVGSRSIRSWLVEQIARVSTVADMVVLIMRSDGIPLGDRQVRSASAKMAAGASVVVIAGTSSVLLSKPIYNQEASSSGVSKVSLFSFLKWKARKSTLDSNDG